MASTTSPVVPAVEDIAGTNAEKPCHRCNASINTQFFKVGDLNFHREHFNCSVCEKALQDQPFHLRDNEIYCQTHFEERFLHTCPGCSLKITPGSGKVLKALGFFYHQGCFKCSDCSVQLSGRFFSQNAKPYCADHAKQKDNRNVPSKPPPTPPPAGTEQKDEMCQVCLKGSGTDKVIMGGKAYHTHCLECKFCKRNMTNRLGERAYFIKEDDANVCICETDYKIMCSKWCVACGESIVREMLYINKGEYYHQECFKCKQCNKHLDTYLCIGGELRCSDHISASNADLTCASCKLPMELNKIFPTVGKKFHKHCLKCSFCNTELDQSTSKLREGLIACASCTLKSAHANDPQTPGSNTPNGAATPTSDQPQTIAGALLSSAPSPQGSTATNGSLSSPTTNGAAQTKPRRPQPKLDTRKVSVSKENKPLPSPRSHSTLTNDELKVDGLDGKASLMSAKSDTITRSVSDIDHRETSKSIDNSAVSSSSHSTAHTSSGFSIKVNEAPQESEPAKKRLLSDADGLSQKQKEVLSKTADLSAIHTAFGGASLGASSSPRLGKTMTPKKIHNWKKGEMIGKGQFGKVYSGLLESGQWIAVKQMELKNEEDEERVKMMEKEVQLMEKLRHENIVSLLGTQRDGNYFYILMEYVPGKSMDVLLKNFGPFPEVTIKWYTLQLTCALAFMHSHGIIHRDIKGKNILVDTNGNLKVADFGSAKQFDRAHMQEAPTLSYNYTPLWTPPEIVTEGEYDQKVDIWALGCVIIEMGSAKLPWHECKFDNPFQILFHIGNSGAIPEIPPQLSETCKDFIRKCLTRDRTKRWDATELLNHEFLLDNQAEEDTLEYDDITV